MKLEKNKIGNVVFEQGESSRFIDKYAAYAEYDGVEMTDEQLFALNDDDNLKFDIYFEI